MEINADWEQLVIQSNFTEIAQTNIIWISWNHRIVCACVFFVLSQILFYVSEQCPYLIDGILNWTNTHVCTWTIRKFIISLMNNKRFIDMRKITWFTRAPTVEVLLCNAWLFCYHSHTNKLSTFEKMFIMVDWYGVNIQTYAWYWHINTHNELKIESTTIIYMFDFCFLFFFWASDYLMTIYKYIILRVPFVYTSVHIHWISILFICWCGCCMFYISSAAHQKWFIRFTCS